MAGLTPAVELPGIGNFKAVQITATAGALSRTCLPDMPPTPLG